MLRNQLSSLKNSLQNSQNHLVCQSLPFKCFHISTEWPKQEPKPLIERSY